MPRPDHILTHADLQPAPLPQFVAATRRAQRRQGNASALLAPDPVVQAEVNQGRWLARCSFCSGAELIDPQDLRFYCLSCDMEAAGRRWLPVKLPVQRAAIEAALLKRPKEEHRNWRPGETVADLRRENAANGV